ncbi:MAG: hypothetical protein QY316_12920 [Thermodesulfobacteriota bacterium]|nr:MAG: hypothetical protein QY316_12920 [Thermodesulfobacteriota bacterium]
MAKKNINKIPQNILEKIGKIESNEVVVGCAVKFKAQDLASGKLKHLGIVLTDEGLKLPTSIIPPESQGKFSSRNINGLEVIRKDLPKETHYNTVDTPNWGNSYYGTHTVDLPYEKYPRDFQSPRELEILITCKDTRPGLSTYVIAFQVQEVLDKRSMDFNNFLFEDLNLLQENVGACSVEPANIPIADYTKSLHLSWEILPPGTLEETVGRIFQGKTPTQHEKNVAAERYNFFQTLKPKSLVFGQSGFRRYFGALLEDNLVVFENIEYGNAVYILFENWEELSKLSRIDLLSGKFGNSFERVVHTNTWEEKVKTIVIDRRNKQK